MQDTVYLLFVAFVGVVVASKAPYWQINERVEKYELPELPYPGYEGLEPYVDAATLKAHHAGHHSTYTTNLNNVLQQWRTQDADNELAHKSILEILQRLDEVPDSYRTAIRNQGGGYVNHCFYWAVMSANPKGTDREPSSNLRQEIEESFGSMNRFTSEFTSAAMKLFGSGYVWLVRDEEGALLLTKTANQDSPVTVGQHPLLVIDVWEHAYYLQHAFRRAVYIEQWWKVVDWDSVDKLDEWWKSTGHDEL